MDELRAYKVLRLKQGCTREEIKEAYAELSKQFHPEEHPEEFQQIYEAYKTLTRGGHQRRTVPQNQDLWQEPEQEKIEPKEREVEPRKIILEEKKTERMPRPEIQKKPEIPEEAERQYDFDSALNRTYMAEQKRLQELTMRAIMEFKILLSPSYCQNAGLFKSFFQKKEYQEILKIPAFMKELAVLLEGTDLKKSIYEDITSYYRLKGKMTNNLTPEQRELYNVLKTKGAMKKKKYRGAITAGILAGIFAGVRSASRLSDVFVPIALLLMFVVICVMLYRWLYQRYSGIASQIMIISGFNILQFFAIIFDLWESFFGDAEAGSMFAILTMMISWVWLAGLIIAAIIIKIKKIIRKK